MIEFYIGVSLVLVLTIVAIVLYTIQIKGYKKHKQQIIEKLNTIGQVLIDGKSMDFMYKDKSYPLKILLVKQNEKLCFNSNSIWEISNKRSNLLIDNSSFVKKEGMKIVIVYPKLGPYLRYENENSIIFTSHMQQFWDILVLDYTQIDEVFNNEHD